jgi:hypothetical protein
MIALILALSVIMWYVIDRFKELWQELKHSKYITVAVSGALAFIIAFAFSLDLIAALGLYELTTTVGIVLTALILMSGSSAVSEIIKRIKGE